MAREADWISNAIWLALLGIAFIVGLVVVGHAFASNTPVLDEVALRVSADYSPDPRAVQVAPVPVVNSAVISETKRDLIIEQTPVAVLGLEVTLTATATPRPSRTPTAARTSTARTTPRQAIEASPTERVVAATFTPTPAPPVDGPFGGPDRSDRNDRSRPTATPTRALVPTSTVRPTATTRPTNTPVPPTDTPEPTNTPEPPTDTPEPPTEAPTDVGGN